MEVLKIDESIIDRIVARSEAKLKAGRKRWKNPPKKKKKSDVIDFEDVMEVDAVPVGRAPDENVIDFEDVMEVDAVPVKRKKRKKTKRFSPEDLIKALLSDD